MTKEEIMEEVEEIYNNIEIERDTSSGYMCAQLCNVESRLRNLIEMVCEDEED